MQRPVVWQVLCPFCCFWNAPSERLSCLLLIGNDSNAQGRGYWMRRGHLNSPKKALASSSLN